MNLPTIVLILQMALSLLSNKNLTADQSLQVNAIVNQAIALANQAVASSTPVLGAAPVILDATSTANTMPIPVTVQIPEVKPQTVVYTPPENIGAPDLSSVVVPAPQPEPSCTLSVKKTSPDDMRYGNFSWTYENLPDNTPAQLYVGNYIGINGDGTTEFQWRSFGAEAKAVYKHYDSYPIDFQLAGHDQFYLSLGKTTCFATYVPQ